jgi:hypothetical protein
MASVAIVGIRDVAPPSWHEFTTDDYYPVARRKDLGHEPWIEASNWIQAMLARQHASEFRLELILR